MRHRNIGRKLSRTSSHRKAMFANMCCSLIEHECMKTTLAKAKELRRYIEPLITVSKKDGVTERRRVFNILRSKAAVGKLFTTLGPRYVERPGGYIRVLKYGYRDGDNAPMAFVELVDRVSTDMDTDNQAQVEGSKDAVASEKPARAKKAAKTDSVVESKGKKATTTEKKPAKKVSSKKVEKSEE